jgi:hypothetical protein
MGCHFANVEGDDDVVHAIDGRTTKKRADKSHDKSHITCHQCHKKQEGHYANECPGVDEDDDDNNKSNRQSGATMLLAGIEDREFSGDSSFQFFQQSEGTVFHDGNNGGVPDHWILLDNQSTVDVFHNKKLLKNIRESDTTMEIHFNAGVTTTNLFGDLTGYGTVWYHPNSIANILSLSRVREHGSHTTVPMETNSMYPSPTAAPAFSSSQTVVFLHGHDRSWRYDGEYRSQ